MGYEMRATTGLSSSLIDRQKEINQFKALMAGYHRILSRINGLDILSPKRDRLYRVAGRIADAINQGGAK